MRTINTLIFALFVLRKSVAIHRNSGVPCKYAGRKK